jgi:hypothetical protein
MHENVVASNVDTLSAQIATVDVRSVFDTDDGDWSTQNRAKYLEYYVEGVGKLTNRSAKCRHSFKAGGAVKGTAIVKVWADAFDRPRVEPVPPDDIVVDELETRYGEPKQLHHRTVVDRDELLAEYPAKKREIERAQGGAGQWQTWAGWRPIGRNEVVVIESWRLPIGTKGHARYRPGRTVKCIDGCTLLDEDYDEDDYPFEVWRWSRPTDGWYGIGVVERIAGIQLALNRRNLQMERKLDHGAFPTVWVHQADAGLATQQTSIVQNAYGTVGTYRGPRPPVTETPPSIAPDELQDAERLSAKASQVSGVSRMASQSVKPAGVETGAALREYRDQTTQRFAEQEKDFEAFVLGVDRRLVAVCKKLGDKAPVISRKTRFGTRSFKWSQVDMQEVRVQISAASTIGRTRAGRIQTVVEWAQAGIISQDEARRLMGHPDLEAALSLYTAAIESVEECIEEIRIGTAVMPEPFMNLKLAVWRAQQVYLKWAAIGAPEDRLEDLRSFIVNAAWMASGGGEQGANDAMAAVGPDQSMPTGAPGQPGQLPPPAPPLAPGALPQGGPAPVGPPPQAAFAPQAMRLYPI